MVSKEVMDRVCRSVPKTAPLLLFSPFSPSLNWPINPTHRSQCTTPMATWASADSAHAHSFSSVCVVCHPASISAPWAPRFIKHPNSPEGTLRSHSLDSTHHSQPRRHPGDGKLHYGVMRGERKPAI